VVWAVSTLPCSKNARVDGACDSILAVDRLVLALAVGCAGVGGAEVLVITIT